MIGEIAYMLSPGIEHYERAVHTDYVQEDQDRIEVVLQELTKAFPHLSEMYESFFQNF